MIPAWKPFDRTRSPLQKAEASIRTGWITALVSCAVTNYAALTGWMGFDTYNLLDAEMFLGLAWGVQLKSRLASTLLVAYFLWSKVYEVLEDPVVFRPNIFTMAYIALYVMAMLGTYRWHRLQRFPAEPAP